MKTIELNVVLNVVDIRFGETLSSVPNNTKELSKRFMG